MNDLHYFWGFYIFKVSWLLRFVHIFPAVLKNCYSRWYGQSGYFQEYKSKTQKKLTMLHPFSRAMTPVLLIIFISRSIIFVHLSVQRQICLAFIVCQGSNESRQSSYLQGAFSLLMKIVRYRISHANMWNREASQQR